MDLTVSELDTLCAEISAQRKVCDEIKEQLKGENAKLDTLENQAITYLTELNREKYQSEFGTISKKETFYFNLPVCEEDKILFFEHLKERGLFDSLATVNSNSYNSYLRKEFELAQESGDAMTFSVPGVPEPKLRTQLTFRKA